MEPSAYETRRKKRRLLTTQASELGFQLRQARLGFLTSGPLFLDRSLCGVGATLGVQSSGPLFLVIQQPSPRDWIPETQTAFFPPQVQVQNLAVSPYTAVAFMAHLETTIFSVSQELTHQRFSVEIAAACVVAPVLAHSEFGIQIALPAKINSPRTGRTYLQDEVRRLADLP